MKKLIPTLMFIGMSLLASKQAEAQQEPYGYVENTITNKNMFVGMNFGNKPMMQPYIEFGSGPISLASWINYDIKGKTTEEVDHYLNYTLPELAKNTSASVTLANYVFPTMGYLSNQELKAKVTYSGLPVDVSIAGGKLLDEKGGHAELLVNKNFELTDKLNASLGGEVYYNNNYFSGGAAGLTHAGLNGSISLKLGDGYGVIGSIAIQKKIDDAFKELVKDEGYGKVTIYKEF